MIFEGKPPKITWLNVEGLALGGGMLIEPEGSTVTPRGPLSGKGEVDIELKFHVDRSFPVAISGTVTATRCP